MRQIQRPFLLISILLVFGPSPSLSFGSTKASRPQIRIATLPADLAAIQDCRRSAYAGKPVNLSSAKSFCNADQIQKEGYICIIAKAKDGKVLGTADLNTKSNVVNNVYVREEARKQGIARLMMEAVEGSMEIPSTLKLTVMSKNTPAVSLYKNLGFQAPGVYGGLDALSSVTPLDFLMEMEKKLS
eukprot:CAMPEP_0172297894 /NCGR_PEP_ID=MMETSP1058-20130122/758_1 /TAXON_ID=83371 /ORGANISM="Detonula confervacea, Strain CCMP 353" /LENGTH=185 /DNA_ID=CAMNT_0013007101 /DNA_START=75 /DNA_END=632 /DNA_ORIENTATION=+